ncbi:MAG: hypothetical protein ABIR24_10755 [Verrucomicrobiota bacterium]
MTDVSGNYQTYFLGEVKMNSNLDIYVSPASNPGVKSIWVDRVYLTLAH